MTVRLVDSGWDHEFASAIIADGSSICIVTPFIKLRATNRLFEHGAPQRLRVLTRFNLNDFREGVSDIVALELLLAHGAEVRGIRNLHAKPYLFGSRRAIVTSANLTEAALTRNHELGFVIDDSGTIYETH